MNENRFAIVFEKLEARPEETQQDPDEPLGQVQIIRAESEEIAELRRAITEIDTPPTHLYTTT